MSRSSSPPVRGTSPGTARSSPRAGPHGGVWVGGRPCPSPAGPGGDVCVSRGPCPPLPCPTAGGVPGAPAGPRGGAAPPPWSLWRRGGGGGGGRHLSYEGRPPLAAVPTPGTRASANHSPNSADGQVHRTNPKQVTAPSLIHRQSPLSMQAALRAPLSRAANQ